MSRRRRRLLAAGIGLTAAGLALLAWIGWQLYVTTWLAHRDQRATVEATQRVWAGGPEVARADREEARDVVALVRIPAFGDDYVVPVREGTDDEVLAGGFGLGEESPAAGAVGNYVLAGHRVTHGAPLADLPDLEAGDVVEVETADATYTYTLDTAGDALTVDLDATWVTAPDPVSPDGDGPLSDRFGSDRLLTLVTCAELFHTDDRLVAFGHLTDRERR